MKLSFAVAALLGVVVASKKDIGDRPKDYFRDDPRIGTPDAPLMRGVGGGMAKPTKKFEIPKNKESEPALSTNMDPTDYESGSGKTYHDKTNGKKKTEGIPKPSPIAGIDESTETAGTTNLWKINTGDSPDPAKEKKTEEKKKEEKEEAATDKEAKEAEKENKKEEKEAKEEKKKEEKEEAKKEEKEEAKKEEKEEKKEEKKKEEKEEKKEKKKEEKEEKKPEKETTPESKSFLQTESMTSCEPAIDVSQKQLDIELDYFSRSFDYKHYKKAMQVYKELKKQGKDPKVSIHTWELYDKAFSFPRVRRYDLVQKHMDLIQHFQDNLNENFTNKLHVDNFIRVAKNAQSALNEKYHQGEFDDPIDYDPEADHPTTWANAEI